MTVDPASALLGMAMDVKGKCDRRIFISVSSSWVLLPFPAACSGLFEYVALLRATWSRQPSEIAPGVPVPDWD